MIQRTHKLFTPQEYLAQEEVAESKSEFFRGEIFAMAGGTLNHNTIASNANRVLGDAVRRMPCRSLTSDQRLLVEENGLYTYPDVVLVCGEPRFAPKRNDTITNPVLIVEVLSDSTREYDRGVKFQLYRDIPTLQHFILVEQDVVRVEYYRKHENEWLFMSYTRLSDALTIKLETGEIKLRVRDLYDKVVFGA
jgi:Uma2 family endonuclease